MTPRRSSLPFVAANAVMWVVMIAILIGVPELVDRWMPIEVARALGWAVASGVWVIALQQQWRSRVRPLTLFAVQLGLWVSAAVVAMWITAMFRMI
jgi:hypothetical protein